jgi:hypothetical protein
VIARVVLPQHSGAVCKLLGLLSCFKVLLTSAALALSWLQVRTVEEQDAEYTFTMAPRPDLNWDGNVKQCPECAAAAATSVHLVCSSNLPGPQQFLEDVAAG